MTADRKQVILDILKDRVGPERSITAERIGEMVFGGPDARTVRAIIAQLIVEDGQGEILASTGSEAFKGCPPGYFWAADWQQCDAYYNVLISRGHDIDRRATAIWKARQRLQRAPRAQQTLGV